MRNKKFAIIPLLIAGAVVLFQYFGADKVTNPETGKKVRVALSSEQEETLGLQSYREILSQSQTIESGPERDLVVRVAERLARATGDAAKDFKWQVSVVRSSQVNAFCLPGGKIVVYTGILPLTQNDAGLATVLGHEVSHATAEHVAERIERERLTEVAAAIIAGGVAFTPGQYVRVVALIDSGATLPFSRSQESEADHIGLVYMARAGYDPDQALAFWKRMLRASKGKEPPEFLSDHPSDAHRVERIKSWLPEAKRAYVRHA